MREGYYTARSDLVFPFFSFIDTYIIRKHRIKFFLYAVFVMQMMRLELTRQSHWLLRPTRIPIPPHLRMYSLTTGVRLILSYKNLFVGIFALNKCCDCFFSATDFINSCFLIFKIFINLKKMLDFLELMLWKL